jgi:hypothetical protein
MHKELFFVNYNTLLHISTLLGQLQGETFRCRYTRLLNCIVQPSVTTTESFSLKMTQQGRNTQECVIIDEEKLFVHSLVFINLLKRCGNFTYDQV